MKKDRLMEIQNEQSSVKNNKICATTFHIKLRVSND
jgi:hypothetical protein